jgi:hypothetical protein
MWSPHRANVVSTNGMDVQRFSVLTERKHELSPGYFLSCPEEWEAMVIEH